MLPSSSRVSLRTVSSSKPQLQHTESRQSVAASDDYYSFSDHTSSTSSRHTMGRYATPDSYPPLTRASTPNVTNLSRTHLGVPEMPRTMGRGGGTPRPGTASSTVRFGEDRIAQISPRSDTAVQRAPSDSDSRGAPTPGLDDGPYIRFAIDQLTRDEEVSGKGRESATGGENEYPVDRRVWDEGLGYFTRSSNPPPTSQAPPAVVRQSSPPRPAPASVEPEMFEPAEPPEDSLLYPALDYVPVALRPVSLGITIVCCLLMIAGVAFSNVWSSRHDGLWDWQGLGGKRYFLFQFLPQILAALITIWTFVIQAAVYRTMPFAIMASERPLDQVLQKLPVLSRNFLLPDWKHFQHGEPLAGGFLIVVWLSNLLSMPLLSCLFQAKWYIVDGQGNWRWTAVQAVGWTLVGLYGLLVIGLVLLLMRFARSWTGLMWDPSSLADLIPLIQRSNVLHDYENTETAVDVGSVVTPRVLRLGYWRLTNQLEIFYGIGEVDAPIRNPSLHQSDKGREKQPHGMAKVSFDLEQQTALAIDDLDHQLYSPFARHRWMVWFLRNTSVTVWIVTAFALFIAFVVVSFAHNAIQGGFPPRLPTLPSTGAFSSSNFLYSFIPALIGNLLFLAWQPVDVYFRALQPLVTLTAPSGATAEKSILLSYPACLPIETTALALLNGHYRVAWISLMSILSASLPILGGGMFIALWYPDDANVRITALMPAFYALVAFCALYTISTLFLRPGRARFLPHDLSTLADLTSFLYQSPLLADKLLREPRSKADLVTRLVTAPPGERDTSLYGLGIYVGRDGREHLGIDRFHRPGRADMLITTGVMKY
ncbi:hypothetical protein ASPZODRAFT_71722 [Penicilliopsis zonata CBS 506.65]|uniref:Phosphoribosylaminoimidazole-succinocarboxamide synthase n=1 Tax=Penicilliopsis zonata CBS 506.65 TaxID=1073090 RepID=A0A1L9SAP8_9EURO|nr:hypothetical protein ASPZODRAFT_71722 [Penicilliopsis zonata CBS 506.65]OJJ44260.1 hypothetical protein ASPZODRAFT_71722 [Penicilliopsis zonata CBS 506.65]